MTIINKEYREYKLDNGLFVALQNTPTQTIAAKLRVNYGSSHERHGEEGLAHFLEHCLVSGGSQKYDPLSADDIRDSFGNSNAFTNIGRTSFVGNMLTEDIGTWLDYTSDHILRPRFDKERVNGERKRILREIFDSKSNSNYYQEFKEAFYRGHPKGRFILGNEEIVKNATLEKISAFHSKGYHPNNMDLIIAGELPENVEELINQYFGSAQMGKNTRKRFSEATPLQEKIILHRPAPERYNIENPNESSAQLVLASIFPKELDKEEPALRTILQILGGGTTSFLYQNMGLKKGLAYNVSTSYNKDYNCREWNVHADVPAKRINEAVTTLFEEIKRIKTQKIPNKMIDRMKRGIKYDFVKTLESNEGNISAIEWKLDKGLTPESYIKGCNSVTSEKVQEVANKYLPDQEKGNYLLYIADPLKK